MSINKGFVWFAKTSHIGMKRKTDGNIDNVLLKPLKDLTAFCRSRLSHTRYNDFMVSHLSQ